MPNTVPSKRVVIAAVFPGFELLDLFGPLEMFGLLSEEMQIRIAAEQPGPVASGMGPQVVAESSLSEIQACDILLIPGGPGTRREIHNIVLVSVLKALSTRAEITASVCTGSALLARAGLLNGRRATTNKRAFQWVSEQSDQVEWVREARWVEDGGIFTSSGVSAGMDMSLAVIGRLLGVERARQVASVAEYEWREDPSRDPFAKENGYT